VTGFPFVAKIHSLQMYFAPVGIYSYLACIDSPDVAKNEASNPLVLSENMIDIGSSFSLK
jgi:hypothetical protein